jgi:phospholipid/cholesterol/gamma-HCH transport system ATP-binding protein
MPAAAPEHLRLDDVTMAFGDRPVFSHLSCSFPKGEISVILGGSGSGKSTILRLIGGLIAPVSGRILVDGQDITKLSESDLEGVRNKLGMLFQGGALLDSLTVFENLALPLREHTALDETAIAEEVHDRLAAVGLKDIDTLLPNQLSGGMRKRVALARAIIMKPVILLCDEPFSGLDPISTRQVEELLVEINERRGITIVVVSHHVDSTMRMAGRIMILLPDGIVSGSGDELREHGDPRVKAFLTADRDVPGDAGSVEVLPGAQG